jgi:hypothetical protein
LLPPPIFVLLRQGWQRFKILKAGLQNRRLLQLKLTFNPEAALKIGRW